jgi:lipid II isoglutaminyl synthase (glutamine-hydrolysing)
MTLKDPSLISTSPWTLKDHVASLLVKAFSWAIRLSGKGSATSLPGKLALRWHPTFLNALAQHLPPWRIIITGTNGKTTTATFLRDIFHAGETPCLLNEKGANLIYGITTCLAQAVAWNGQYAAKVAVIETDEATVGKVAQAGKPSDLVVLNLFRDQLDRYGELSTTAGFIEQGIPYTTETLFLNADDPMLVGMGQKALQQGLRVIYFGLNVSADSSLQARTGLAHAVPHPQEVANCPECGQAVLYHSRSFAHLGDWFCNACGFKRPTLQASLTPLALEAEGWLLSLDHDVLGQGILLKSPLLGLYNAYNVLAGACVAGQYHTPVEAIQQALTIHQPMFGRSEKRLVAGKAVQIMLIKNPAGACEVLKQVCADKTAHVLIALNDAYADGEDVSWIWDADFEQLLSTHPNSERYTLSGSRAYELANRLEHATLLSNWHPKVEPSLKTALIHALAGVEAGETLYILPTYTALLEL